MVLLHCAQETLNYVSFACFCAGQTLRGLSWRALEALVTVANDFGKAVVGVTVGSRL